MGDSILANDYDSANVMKIFYKICTFRKKVTKIACFIEENIVKYIIERSYQNYGAAKRVSYFIRKYGAVS